MFYQAVVATMLMYGRESLVMFPSVLKAPECFHMGAAQWLVNMHPKQRTVGPLVYPKCY